MRDQQRRARDHLHFHQRHAGDLAHLADADRRRFSLNDAQITDLARQALIIDAANRVITRNPERLKQDHPIQINAARRDQPKGGEWESLDPERAGRVLRLRIEGEEGARANLQAQAVMAELQRLLSLNGEEWQGCAVLARKQSATRGEGSNAYTLTFCACCNAYNENMPILAPTSITTS